MPDFIRSALRFLSTFAAFGIVVLAALSSAAGTVSAQLPDKDLRADKLIDADHYELRMPEVKNLQQWEKRKLEIQRRFLLTAGLWPPPEKPPLKAHIFDERRGKGFRVAKVYFESLPGYYVTGSLYRPAEGQGPFPAVVCPHGHWKYGRLTNGVDGSIPGRCIDLARMGCVVMSIDMVGYNDNFQLPHDPNKSLAQLKADEPLPYEPRLFRADFDFPVAELYGFSLAGLQAWNCIRAVDFLISLPEVDSTRIAATGASGGASQTIFLIATDPRLKVAAPVNIIGAAKHPGCRCENMPGGWIDLSTIEVAATFAPKPLILLSATEDPWTNSFPTRELPIFKKYYGFYGAEDMVNNVHIQGGHNYNAQTRAAVYEWFAKYLKTPNTPIKDPPVIAPEMKALGDLRVFPDHILPESAKDGFEIIADWIAASENMFQNNLPRTQAELSAFIEKFGGGLFRLLQLEHPDPEAILSRKVENEVLGGLSHEQVLIGRSGKGDLIGLEMISSGNSPKGTLVLVRPEGRGGMFMPGGGGFKPGLKNMAVQDYRICRVGGYASGDLSIPLKVWDSFSWPEAYNRDNHLNGIQDVLTALYYVKKTWPGQPITLVGMGGSGLAAAFAGAFFGEAAKVVVDLDGCDPGYDREFLKLMPIGNIKRVGDFRTAALMLMRKKLTLLNASPTFDGGWYKNMAARLNLAGNLELRLNEQINWPTEGL
ncbi:MAG: hypothetical protein A3F83_08195 [Candidatus Glassbacteria bacterium RIFCSPLOWO2_12_FULL_58_11]|uniref:Acetyl xylan esterase domain-containing protein n=1 Tax=Candidatus Glassbacteria bacterium RIFCSPLOWO2_12_FULL_58_11 TaxID=1817867 RepID=A0A1F5YK45_9BACT|nr:MAG: hypothetical protein A3F83_08195 [Candidatus Glassbacteria bacterium RIFCSPLOWO2_12_FULL_58_11]